ncbi:MAG: sensor histidine kinase [Thermoanaerobaculia bacterium]
MHPILAAKGWLGRYVAGWTFVGGGLLWLFVMRGGFTPLEGAALVLPMELLYAFMALSAWYVCRSTPLSWAKMARVAATCSLAALAASILWVLAGAAVAAALDWMVHSPETFAARYAAQVPALFAAGAVLYTLSIGLHYGLLSFEKAREAGKRETQRKILAREAELTALKAQLQPHFLFNSLNSISALTSTDPTRARQMCVSLAEFFRKSLAVEERKSIPIGEELSLAKSYLEVEQIRFGERLTVEERIEEPERRWLVPPLLLQPLIENAVRHGIGTLVKGGVVRIEVARAGGRLRIVVSNPFDPDVLPAGSGRGLGLRLVRDRLLAAYGPDAIFATKKLEGVHLAILSIPVRNAA